MHPTDRQLRQMTCLGSGLSVFGLTERLGELLLKNICITEQPEKQKNHLDITHLNSQRISCREWDLKFPTSFCTFCFVHTSWDIRSFIERFNVTHFILVYITVTIIYNIISPEKNNP